MRQLRFEPDAHFEFRTVNITREDLAFHSFVGHHPESTAVQLKTGGRTFQMQEGEKWWIDIDTGEPVLIDIATLKVQP